jgi:hypothetical protein|nr:hypothetical protein [uncultured Prevotella sp.]
MEGQDYGSHIQRAKDNICQIIDVVKTCDNSQNWESLLDDVLTWIKEIETDFKNNIIPESYLKEIDGILQPFLYERKEQNVEEITKSIKEENVGELKWKNRQSFSLKNLLYHADSYRFYKQLDFAQSNTVVVGANGCGKTTLANTLFQTLGTANGIVIPAQKLLIIPSYSSIPNYSSVSKQYDDYQHQILDDKQTYNMSLENSLPYNLVCQYGNELRYLISTLIAEQVSKNNAFSISVKRGGNLILIYYVADLIRL